MAPPQARPLIFSQGTDFQDPPRPPPPPPPQHSPRIKLERHTPYQFMCCCMRNECERSSSRNSIDLRRGMLTPQHHIANESSRRPTPHSYKMEPPSPSSSRARTPHQNVPGLFIAPMSPRCMSNDNHLTATLGSPCIASRINTAVQTERDKDKSSPSENKRHFVPNLSLARSVTHHQSKVNQSTMTEDLSEPNLPSEADRVREKLDDEIINDSYYNQLNKDASMKDGESDQPWQCSQQSREQLSQLETISMTLSNFEWNNSDSNLVHQLSILSRQEGDLLKHLDILQQEANILAKKKKKVTDELNKLHHIRSEKIRQMVGEVKTDAKSSSNNPVSCTSEQVPPSKSSESTSNIDCKNSSVKSKSQQNKDGQSSSLADNSSVVSSSQETIGLRVRSFSFTHTSPNDSSNESQSARRQRCTSTSHSPSINPKNYDTNEDIYQNLETPNAEFYSRLEDNECGNRRSVSNTDSDTDDEGKMTPKFSRRTTGLRGNLEDSKKRTDVRMRDSSISSSGEGDVESEINIDKEENRNDNCCNIRHSLSSNEEIAVVGSSQQVECSLINKPSGSEMNVDDYDVDDSELRLEANSTNNYTPKMIGEEESRRSDDMRDNPLDSRRKSLSLSPHSPKTRNSSGSEHSYSLRSKGPPSEVVDSDSQQSKDTFSYSLELANKEDIKEVNSCSRSKMDEGHADDEDEEKLVSSQPGSRGKRKRKTKHKANKKKKRSQDFVKISSINHLKKKNKNHGSFNCKSSLCIPNIPNSPIREDDVDTTVDICDEAEEMEVLNLDSSESTKSELPLHLDVPAHKEAVLDLKVS